MRALIIVLLLPFVGVLHADELSKASVIDYRASVRALKKGASTDLERRTHLQTIYNGDANAVHALAAHFDDTRLTGFRFVSWRLSYRDPETGKRRDREPTMSDAAFELIEYLLEPIRLPKMYGTFFTDLDMLKEWLKSRQDLTLHEMRTEIATTRLEKETAADKAKPTKFSAKHVQYLRDHLRQIEKQKSAKTRK